MSLRERTYSVLIVSAAETLNRGLLELLPASRYSPQRVVRSVSMAKQALGERDFDFVIVNSPLPDESGVRFAIDLCAGKNAVVLMLLRAEFYEETFDKVAQHGVFTLQKPISRSAVTLALDWMASTRERLRKTEKKALSLEERMEEIRLVNRAKWLLISEQQMDEPAAHRYIEKLAMDRCLPKREIARMILDDAGEKAQ